MTMTTMTKAMTMAMTTMTMTRQWQWRLCLWQWQWGWQWRWGPGLPACIVSSLALVAPSSLSSSSALLPLTFLSYSSPFYHIHHLFIIFISSKITILGSPNASSGYVAWSKGHASSLVYDIWYIINIHRVKHHHPSMLEHYLWKLPPSRV